jgi:protoporphyrin/coproporphyrin ferrochelatase
MTFRQIRYLGRPDYRHGEPARAAVLLVNLGTPDAPETAPVRRYLAEFLGDPRVIELPRLLWRLILHGVILRLRPRRSAHAYASIWGTEGSPLLSGSQALARATAAALGCSGDSVLTVALAMRYGKPSLREVLRDLHRRGLRRLLVLPLYPQYSATTSASVFDAVVDELKSWRWLPELRFLTDYYREPAYLDALADSVRTHWQAHGRAQRLLFSFHGIPQRYFSAGDPYHCHCQYTAREVAARLGLGADQWQLAFQSRVGREPWLQPYTDKVLETLPEQGVRELQVICPGFAIDCLETLEEIAMQNRDAFIAAGGTRFEYIPCLNDSTAHATLMADLVRRSASDWPELAAPGATAVEDADARKRYEAFVRE